MEAYQHVNSNPNRKIAVKCIFALLVLISFLTIGKLTIQYFIKKEDDSARYVEMAAHLRILNLSISHKSLDILLSNQKFSSLQNKPNQLKSLLAQAEKTLHVVIYGDPALGLQSIDSPEIHSLFFGTKNLYQQMQQLITMSQKALSAAYLPPSFRDINVVKYFQSNAIDILDQSFMEAESIFKQQTEIYRLQVSQCVMLTWLIVLIVIVLEAWFIFRPIILSIGNIWSSLSHQRSQAQDALAKAQQANMTKNQFLAKISHELRTPLNGVMGILLLLAKTRLNEHQIFYVKKAQTSAKVLLHLIEDLLDFSKIEVGMMAIEYKEFNLLESIDTVISIIELEARRKNLTFRADIQTQLPESILGDKYRLKQILLNLLSNAVKFTHVGEVSLSCSYYIDEKQTWFVFEVKDTGEGIAMDDLPRLLEPFEQHQSHHTLESRGTGLGLAIVNHLCHLMGGQLTCQSEQGKGTCFSVRLPLRVVEQEEDIPLEHFKEIVQSLNVLIVDDDDAICRLIKAILNCMGVSAKIASTAEEAMALFQHYYEDGHALDLIFVDWDLGKINGEQMVRKMRNYLEDAEEQPPAFVLVSAFRAGEASSYDRRLFDAALSKPFETNELVRTMLAVLRVRINFIDEEQMKKMRLVGKRILVVEDQEINRLVAQDMLVNHGAEVITANNGKDALEHFIGSHFDAVLMDIHMPIMDGLEATRLIRQEVGYSELPIIGLSANASEPDRLKSLESGMNGYVVKPLLENELIDELAKWLSEDQDTYFLESTKSELS